MGKVKLLINKSEEFISKNFFTIFNEVLLIFFSSLSLSIFILYKKINANEFINTNVLESDVRGGVVKLFIIIFFVFALLSVGAYYCKYRNKNIFFIYRSFLFLSLLVNLRLFTIPTISGNPILFFSLLLFFDLVLFYFIKNFPAITWFSFFKKDWVVKNIYVFIALTALLYFILIDTVRLMNFQKSVDLGMISNLMYRLTHFFDSYVAMYDQRFFTETHFSPIFILVSIIYYFFPNPFFLLFLQDILLVLGGVMLYKLSVHMTKERMFSLLLATGYFLSPLLHGIVNYDFHEIAFFPFLFLLFVYFLEKEAFLKSAITLVFVLMIKEEIALYILPFSLYIFYRHKNLIYTAAYIFICLTYYIFAVKFYMNAVMINRFWGVIANGYEGLSGIFATFISNPIYTFNFIFQNDQKLFYLFVVLFSVGFIALKSKQFLFILLPASFVFILASYFAQYSFVFHYGGPILPIIYFLAIVGYNKLKEPLKKKIGGILLLNSVVVFIFFSPLFNASLAISKDHFNDYRAFQKFVEQIPENENVSGSHSVSGYVANRDTIRLFPDIKNSEYILVDINGAPWPLKTRKELFDTLAYMERRLSYGVIDIYKNGILLFKKDAVPGNVFSTKSLIPSQGVFNFTNLNTELSRIDHDSYSKNKLVWSNKSPDLRKGFLAFGPYISLDSGAYNVVWYLKTTDKNTENKVAGFVDVNCHPHVLIKKALKTDDIYSDSTFKKIETDFILTEPKSNMEFRLYSEGNVEILFDYLEIKKK